MSTPLYIPRSILKNRKLSPYDILVYSVVRIEPEISNKELRQAFPISLSALNNSFQRLEAQGLIKRYQSRVPDGNKFTRTIKILEKGTTPNAH